VSYLGLGTLVAIALGRFQHRSEERASSLQKSVGKSGSLPGKKAS
jgi:hypothetical protein